MWCLGSAFRAPPRPTRFPYTPLFRSPPRTATPLIGFSRVMSSACRATPSGSSIAVRAMLEPLGVALHALRSEEHTSELQSRFDLVCRLLLEKKKHQATYKPFSEPKMY